MKMYWINTIGPEHGNIDQYGIQILASINQLTRVAEEERPKCQLHPTQRPIVTPAPSRKRWKQVLNFYAEETIVRHKIGPAGTCDTI